jgi:hypothetical protein
MAGVASVKAFGHESLKGLAQHVTGRPTEGLLRRPVVHDDVTGIVDAHDGVHGRIKERSQATQGIGGVEV